MIISLQDQVNALQGANQNLQQESSQARMESQKATSERAEACTAVIKLDEARILLNKLLGPQGPLSMSERHKILNQAPLSGETSGDNDNTLNDRSG